jgi:hypothetical protein
MAGIRMRVVMARALVAWALVSVACANPPASHGWSYSYDAATADQLDQVRAGVKMLVGEITEAGLTPAGSASTVRHGVDRAEVRDVKTSWTGAGFGLRGLRIEVSERNRPANGPEVVVSLTAAVPSDEAGARFREFQQHVVEVLNPASR